ncbi:hypothetical protein [Polyangium jinanense]|uniref:Lipoprotein n=1 Tax=Polyangium jinanense TaxID=2829994 RepID=A0A9X4AVP4_9BACT|nr:hypothetical protein [Polyangium jinanense]MDC3960730.1 hypothetical protein [Polyangium jinanense]MDC3984547.1 hypothetical protein [Polyangium jinanense]
MTFRASHFLAPALLALSVVACGGTAFTSTKTAEPVLIARAESPAEVRAAVIRAMEARRFSALGEEPGKIAARLDKGEITLDVDIEYSGTQYVVKYVKSTGLQTKPGPGGEVLVDDHWSGWVRGLRARIGEELLVPKKEAAETAKREREYQLLIEQHKTAQAQANAQAAQAASQPPQTQPVQGQVVIPIPLPQLPAGGVNLNHSTTHGSQTITCCINGAFYACPSQEAYKKCMSLGPHECTRDTSKSCK